jgi:uncharacterized protein YndB with AHSA1/START domain
MSVRDKNEHAELTIVHEFNAPKEMVFNAFSDAEALGEWWGPVECKNTVLKLDFRKGGIFHFKMEKDGVVNFGRFTFGELRPHDLLEFTNSFSDANGNIIPAPFEIKLPLKIFYRLVFTEKGGKTTITLTGQPVDATNEEILNFRSINANVQEGFGATFRQLAFYLAKVNSRLNNKV